MIHFIGYAQNGVPVYVDLVASEAAKHVAYQPYLLTLAAEALQHIDLSQPAAGFEYDMGRIIGHDFVVETTEADTIFYVQLVRDSVYTRFTKNGKALPTKYLSMILERSPGLEGPQYNMRDIWVGRFIPPRPGSAEETAESGPYWKEHAFVFENQPIQSRTITKTCPY